MIRLRYLTLSVLAVLIVVSIVPFVSSDVIRGESTVPDWVKNTADWWASDQIPDSAFLQGIQFLIKEKIIIVQIPAVDSEVVEEVPGWIKNTAGWWAEDKIHDVTFVAAIKYLISQGIITVEQEVEAVEESVEAVEEIKDFYMEINGGNCCVNWTYVNEEYRFEITTFDKKYGNQIDGVTITAKIISKSGELRHDFGQVTTEDGIYRSSITIPNMDWYAENILSVTGEYYGVEKTIEKEFEVFNTSKNVSPVQQATAGGCAYVGPVSVNSQESGVQGITFSNSGDKMFITGYSGDDVNEYSLTGPYCIGTATFVGSFNVSSQATAPADLEFNRTGDIMYIVQAAGSEIYQYKLSTRWNVSTASYDSSFDLSNEDSQPRGVAFDTNGDKMFIVGSADDEVNEYTLSSRWDVTTATYVQRFSVTGQDKEVEGIAFDKNGYRMFINGYTNDKVYEYHLTSAFNISTASYVDAFSVADQDTQPRDVKFDSSGYAMFILGDIGNDINVYKLTTPFDVSTATFVE